MKIISNLFKDSRDEWLVKITDKINRINPVVDRIMDDESVEGVVMTNRDGAPILTNISVTNATTYGLRLNPFAVMTQCNMKEMDPYDDVLIVRINTKKKEIMLVPDPEFNLIVLQHARLKAKQSDNKK